MRRLIGFARVLFLTALAFDSVLVGWLVFSAA